jgi:Zn-dependent M28 family amino/carboxypeptidase
MTKRAATLYLTFIGLLLLLVAAWYIVSFLTLETDSAMFDGQRALADVQTQVDFGPRIPGTEGHEKIRTWMRAELESAGWMVDIQETEMLGHPIFNVTAKRNNDAPQIILGAHYDTRIFADHDADAAKQTRPVPGANDGASGVAVLLELARTLPETTVPVWLVFFDAEDNGQIQGWDWILGSRAFASELSVRPQAVIIVDMIGDANLNIHFERNSDATLRAEIWETAASLGHDDVFIAREKHSMLDDHTPFLQAGIPSVDIIDFDYAYWHTTQDTPDKVSAASLQAVGETLWAWVTAKNRQ